MRRWRRLFAATDSGVTDGFLTRRCPTNRYLSLGVVLGALAFVSTFVSTFASAAQARTARATAAHAPLCGVVRAGGVPVAGATLLVRGVTGGVESALVSLKTGPDGTFVWSDAAPGLYTLVSVVPGYRPKVARILHRAEKELVSFVPLDLERADGVLPVTPLGESDPWIARALVQGDVLRETSTPLEPVSEPSRQASGTARMASTSTIPVRASVSSLAGFGADGGANHSRASLDLSGTVGSSLHWGLEGQYSRADFQDRQGTGDASRLALDLDSGADQRIRLSTRRQFVPRDENLASRYAAHGVDWTGSTGDRSSASISARMSSQSNLPVTGPVAELFSRASSAFEVLANYRTELAGGPLVRVSMAYRSLSDVDTLAADRETRVGAAAGVRVLEFLVLEGGATGDVSSRARGLTPELTISVLTRSGWKAFAFASRRFERRTFDERPLGVAGIDDGDVTRLSRAVYRVGVRHDGAEGDSLSVEASQREISGSYRYLLDPDFLDRLDSLYFFSGDLARELGVSSTFRLGRKSTVSGRISARAGEVRGDRDAGVERDGTWYGIASAAVRFAPTKTTVEIGYRSVSQALLRGDAELRNDLDAVDFTLAQALPLPVFQEIGSEWRALFSFALGHRREGHDPYRSNRQLAGGLSFSF